MLFRHMTDCPTVEEVLALAAFSGCRILGGSEGCQRRVRGVNLTDTPDYARWLSPGELLLTTGFALAGDEAAIESLLPTAAERGLAGVGIKPGRFLSDPLPGSLAREADRLGLPLIALPGDARFAALSAAVSREIARRQIPSEQARRLEEYVRHLLSGPLEDPAAEARQAGAFGLHPERGHILVRAGSHPGKWDCWRAWARSWVCPPGAWLRERRPSSSWNAPGTGLHRKKLCSGGWRPSAGTRAGCAA